MAELNAYLPHQVLRVPLGFLVREGPLVLQDRQVRLDSQASTGLRVSPRTFSHMGSALLIGSFNTTRTTRTTWTTWTTGTTGTTWTQRTK